MHELNGIALQVLNSLNQLQLVRGDEEWQTNHCPTTQRLFVSLVEKNNKLVLLFDFNPKLKHNLPPVVLKDKEPLRSLVEQVRTVVDYERLVAYNRVMLPACLENQKSRKRR